MEAAFTASAELGIPRMLEISDLVGIDKPDEQSVMAYISAHYHVCPLFPLAGENIKYL